MQLPAVLQEQLVVTSAPAGTTRPLCGGGRGWSPSAAPRAPSFCVRCKKEAVFVCHADCSHYACVHPKGAAKQLKIGARHHRKPQQPSSPRGTKAALALLGGSTRAATTHNHCTLLQHPAAQQGCPQLTGEIWTLPLHHKAPLAQQQAQEGSSSESARLTAAHKDGVFFAAGVAR